MTFEFSGWRTFNIRKIQISSDLSLNRSFSEKKNLIFLDDTYADCEELFSLKGGIFHGYLVFQIYTI